MAVPFPSVQLRYTPTTDKVKNECQHGEHEQQMDQSTRYVEHQKRATPRQEKQDRDNQKWSEAHNVSLTGSNNQRRVSSRTHVVAPAALTIHTWLIVGKAQISGKHVGCMRF
jgi:hypothetical protein